MRLKSIALIGSYIGIRFGLENILWSKISVYWSYCAEIFFVILGHYILKVQHHFRQGHEKKLGLLFILSLILGAFFFILAKKLQLMIPFDFKSIEGFILMVLVAPILEELIYRKVIWDSSLFIWNNNLFVLSFNCCFFAFAHMMSYWFVPEEFKNFVLFQTWYTFVLAFLCGVVRNIFSDVKPAILIHFGFNLIFFMMGHFY